MEPPWPFKLFAKGRSETSQKTLIHQHCHEKPQISQSPHNLSYFVRKHMPFRLTELHISTNVSCNYFLTTSQNSITLEISTIQLETMPPLHFLFQIFLHNFLWFIRIQEITTATETVQRCIEIDKIFVTNEIFVTVQSLRLNTHNVAGAQCSSILKWKKAKEEPTLMGLLGTATLKLWTAGS